ncbi:MAG TPA: hypothetical protein VG144_05255, partial [Gaiellaceae bacterium]|nr:hypothetical protein [Gaiellaceae bacterium]
MKFPRIRWALIVLVAVGMAVVFGPSVGAVTGDRLAGPRASDPAAPVGGVPTESLRRVPPARPARGRVQPRV